MTTRVRMRHILPLLLLAAVLVMSPGCPVSSANTGVFHCYLTWQGDTGTTMTVNYHTTSTDVPSQVFYDTVPRNGVVEEYAFSATGASHELLGLSQESSDAARAIHVVELTSLTPGQTYYFIAGDATAGYTSEKMFRTIPDSGAVRFITGGDMGTDFAVGQLLRQAAGQSPMAALIGGDVAYANADFGNWKDWDRWLDLWEDNMVTPEGHTVPIILAIGNHETTAGFFQFLFPKLAAPFYFGYFAQEGRAYFVRELGPHARVFALDTSHVTSMTGAQQRFLDQELAATPAGVHTFALYHVPMYPSHRAFGGLSMSMLVRNAWLSTFDAHGLTAAFENHDHMLKRTKRLRNNAPHPDGTLYLGDGCFGKTPRSGEQARALEDPAELARLGLTESYLANWASTRHFWMVDVAADGSGVEFTAIGSNGDVVDETAL
jgi:Purple acid Phosphatase, N-terminal domain/Calcineurin-like phosphoesterase